MRKFKKFAAMTAALTLAACAVAPVAFAADPEPVTAFNLSVTAPNVSQIEDVTAYMIFGISTQSDGSYKVSSDSWACDTAIKDAIIKYGPLGLSDSSKPSDALTEISKLDADSAAALARAISNAIDTKNAEAESDAEKVSDTALTKITSGDDLGKYTFGGSSAPDNGYYIVLATARKINGNLDTVPPTDGDEADELTKSLGMLTVVDGVADDIGVGTAKVGLPKVEKKVWEDDKTAGSNPTYESNPHWNDVADLEIGQTATFRLYGTLPENYANYTSYKYYFKDTLDVTFEKPVASNVNVKLYKSEDDAKTATGGTAITVTPTISDITDGTNVTGYSIEVGWDDLKSVTGLDKNSVIVVEYTTALTDKAIVASTGGQLNAVKLEYSNNPNQGGEGTTATTPEDKVIVYTYDLEVDKTFFAGSPLTDEEIKNKTYGDFKFSLYASDGNTKINVKPCTDDTNYDYVIDNSATASNTDMVLSVYDGFGNRVDASTITSESDVSGYKLAIKIKGVDSQVYQIGEDQSGRTSGQKYNDIDNKDATVAVTTEDGKIYVQNFDGTNVSLGYTVGDGTNKGSHQVDILNESGVKLPGTGGIGTTVFYLGGGAMVAVAGVLLITKKRVGKKTN